MLILWRCVNVHPLPPNPAPVDALPSPSRVVLLCRCGYRRSLSLSFTRLYLSVSIIFHVYAGARVCFCSIHLFRSAKEQSGSFDNRSASILIQTATKTTLSTRQSYKITPIAALLIISREMQVVLVAFREHVLGRTWRLCNFLILKILLSWNGDILFVV